MKSRQPARLGAGSAAGLLSLLALGLSSVYVFPSGLPQPGDAFWLLFCAMVVAHTVFGGVAVPFPLLMRVWLLLFCVVAIVNAIWAARTVDSRFFMPIAYWAYNLTVGWSVLVFMRSQGARSVFWLRMGLLLGLYVSGAGVLFDLGSSARTSGWFNNPNQLAYHSICLTAMLLLVDGGRLRFSLPTLAAYGAAIVGLLSASSLAGFGGLVIIGCGVVVASGVSVVRIAKASAVLVSLLLIVVVIGVAGGGVIFDNVATRMDRMGSKVENVEDERKLYRIAEHPKMVVLGAGEGGQYRFGPNEAGEMHSSFGTMLFSYGLVGFSLFMLLLGIVIKSSRFWVAILVCAPLLYSLTHMGLRFTVFWIFLVVAFELGGADFVRGAPKKGASSAKKGSRLKAIEEAGAANRSERSVA